eukprot:3833699-Rhodomonas_salina.1
MILPEMHSQRVPPAHKSEKHPLILRFLERYIRKPLENSIPDRVVFSPCKTAYLAVCQSDMAARCGRNPYHKLE